MADIIEIPKINKARDNYPCWVPVMDLDNNIIKPNIMCICGQYCGIGKHHVHADGRVTASFYHKHPEDPKGCGWHVYLKLMDYDRGSFPPNK